MGFKFMPTEKEIDIEGNRFTLRVGDAETLDSLDMEGILAAGKAGGPPARVTELCGRYAGLIEAMLGKGSYGKIFDGRRPNIIDHVRLFEYLSGEMNGLAEARDRAVLGPTAGPELVKAPGDTVQ
jgi:hypothetical protein